MINEFRGGRKRVFMINSQKAGRLEIKADVHASEFYANSEASDVTTKPRSALAIAHSTRNNIRGYVQKTFLPENFPRSVSPDMLQAARWDFLQCIASTVAATLGTRAVLVAAGVGSGTATASSSSLAWIVRDAVQRLAGILLSSHVATGLENRAKTWRLVADVSCGLAILLEVLTMWLPSYGCLAFTALAALIRSIVGVAGAGAKASFTQHFAWKGNTADVTAKAANRDNVAGLMGVILGILVSVIVPEKSRMLNLLVTTAILVLHLFCNIKSVHCTILTSLNAPRFEWCLQRYLRFEHGIEAVHKRTDDTTASESLVGSDTSSFTGNSFARSTLAKLGISPLLANDAEGLFMLPPSGPTRAPGLSYRDDVHRWVYTHVPALQVSIRFGVSIFDLLQDRVGLTTRAKQDVAFGAEACLAGRGVCLVYDVDINSYSVLFPELYTKDGCPKSWDAYRRSAGIDQKKSNQLWSVLEDENDEVEELPTTQREQQAEQIVQRQMWAYFYAYCHQLAVQRVGGGRAVVWSDKTAPSPLVVICALREDGVLDMGAQTTHSDVRATAVTGTTDASVAKEVAEPYGEDTLYPKYLKFMDVVKAAGWKSTRFLIPNEGWTVAVHYL